MEPGTRAPSGESAAPAIRRRRGFLFGAGAVAIATAGALLILEIVIRLTRTYHTPETDRAGAPQYEPAIFARHVFKPDQEFLDEKIKIRINSRGYRGPEFAEAKPEGAVRIIFVGGSMVFTLRARDGEDWPSLAGRALRDRGFANVEIINAGVPGHASFDSLGRFYSELWTYHPDIVVLCNAWNDVKYFADLGEAKPLLRGFRPYDPEADPRLHYRNGLDALLCRSSQLYVRLRDSYYERKLKAGAEGAAKMGELRPDYPARGPEQYRLNLLLFADAVRRAGARPVLMTQPTLVAPDNTPEERSSIEYGSAGLTHEALVRALEECRRIAVEAAKETGAGLIDPWPAMTGDGRYFRDHVHTTKAGNMKLAEIVAEGLAPLLAGPAGAAAAPSPEEP